MAYYVNGFCSKQVGIDKPPVCCKYAGQGLNMLEPHHSFVFSARQLPNLTCCAVSWQAKGDTLGCDRISDQGGGIAPEDLTKVWQYGYTTMEQQDNSRYQGTSDLDPIWATRPESAAQYRMGGLGFGLPMSRLYAEYFGECAGCSTLLTLCLARLLKSSAVLCLPWHVVRSDSHLHTSLATLWCPGCSYAILGSSRLA